ncbi:unnamed protein product, partial [Effrenium voratum]
RRACQHVSSAALPSRLGRKSPGMPLARAGGALCAPRAGGAQRGAGAGRAQPGAELEAGVKMGRAVRCVQNG